jgi:hypothetical protein
MRNVCHAPTRRTGSSARRKATQADRPPAALNRQGAEGSALQPASLGPCARWAVMRQWLDLSPRDGRSSLDRYPEGGLRNRSLTQWPGAVSAIQSGLLMTTRSREARAGRRTATARAGRSP